MNQIPFPAELRGTHKFVKWGNQLLRAAKANRHLMGDHTGLTETPMGMFRISKRSSAVESTKIKLCKIAEISSDNLRCIVYSNGIATTEEIRVARPDELRGAQTRTLTLEAGPPIGTINEEIRRPYVVNDFIYAGDADGGTDVLFGGQRLEWIDLNVIGRCWHTARIKVCVKVGGVERQIFVEGGPIFG